MTLRSEAIAYIREELVCPDPLTDALQQLPLEAGHVTTYLPERATDEDVRNLRACGLYQRLLQWTKPTNCSPLTGTLAGLARTKAELLCLSQLGGHIQESPGTGRPPVENGSAVIAAVAMCHSFCDASRTDEARHT